jgi:hypothetical protein
MAVLYACPQVFLEVTTFQGATFVRYLSGWDGGAGRATLLQLSDSSPAAHFAPDLLQPNRPCPGAPRGLPLSGSPLS